uniref:Uncharacterized protein n=1 Tax=Setaria viridis TaxID=4556 RepID=A0A4V6D8Y7_SETVI|nr:hypothetical protein SEVIR_4G299901v2 [Setaria viridis]
MYYYYELLIRKFFFVNGFEIWNNREFDDT